MNIKETTLVTWTVIIVSGASTIFAIHTQVPIYLFYSLFILAIYYAYIKTYRKLNNIKNIDIKKQAFKNTLSKKYKTLMTNQLNLIEKGFIDGANYIINNLDK